MFGCPAHRQKVFSVETLDAMKPDEASIRVVISVQEKSATVWCEHDLSLHRCSERWWVQDPGRDPARDSTERPESELNQLTGEGEDHCWPAHPKGTVKVRNFLRTQPTDRRYRLRSQEESCSVLLHVLPTRCFASGPNTQRATGASDESQRSRIAPKSWRHTTLGRTLDVVRWDQHSNGFSTGKLLACFTLRCHSRLAAPEH